MINTYNIELAIDSYKAKNGMEKDISVWESSGRYEYGSNKFSSFSSFISWLQNQKIDTEAIDTYIQKQREKYPNGNLESLYQMYENFYGKREKIQKETKQSINIEKENYLKYSKTSTPSTSTTKNDEKISPKTEKKVDTNSISPIINTSVFENNTNNQNIAPKSENTNIIQNPPIITNENFSKNNTEENAQTKIENHNLINSLPKSFTNPELYTRDTSILRFVGKNQPLNNIEYIPSNLIFINHPHIIAENMQLTEPAASALYQLADDFYKNFSKNIKLNDAYRSYSEQQAIIEKNPTCITKWLCALPGESEHQLGLAIDINGFSLWRMEQNPDLKKQYEWFRENAHKYGYTESYQHKQNNDGYAREPWHWRFVGIEMATFLKNNSITFSEYISNFRK